MIQRIQTLYLANAFILTGLLFFLNLGEIAVIDKMYSFTINGIVDSLTGKTVYSSWYLIVLAGIILLLQGIVIFSYKKRKRQIQFATLNAILMILLAIGCWLFVKFSANSLGDGVYSLKLSMVFPLVSIFFNYMACLAIKRDEDLIKSVDRIR
jgi:hypothetical protein